MTVLVTSHRDHAAELVRLAEGRVAMPSPILIEVAKSSPSTAIGAARTAHGGDLIGFVAENETAALEAIAAGADEAIVGIGLDARGAVGFFERLKLRGSLRRQQENRHTAVAHNEKLAALGTVVAGVAHEINNPLGAAMLIVSMLKLYLNPLAKLHEELVRLVERGSPLSLQELRDLTRIARTGTTSSEVRAMVQDLEGSIESVAQIVRDLRIFGRADEEEKPIVVSLPELIDQVIRVVGRAVTVRGHLERDYSPDVPLLALPRGRIAQVFTNVLINAAHAIAEVDRSTHRVRISIRADAEAVAVSISDTGPGIPPEAVERIFDPFFTTKREGEGTGLGLSISRSIVRRLGGDLILESVHGMGATFVVILPVPDQDALEAAQRRTPDARELRKRSRCSVMVVDDDDRLLRTYPRILRDRFDVLIAADGQEAIDLLRSGSNPDVIVSDLLMPVVNGKQLHAWLLNERPELAARMIFVSASTFGEHETEFSASIKNPMLEKPVNPETLLAAIDDVLAANNR